MFGIRFALFSGNSSGMLIPRSSLVLRLASGSRVVILFPDNWYLNSLRPGPSSVRTSVTKTLPRTSVAVAPTFGTCTPRLKMPVGSTVG
jgi:hypothetical protein